LPLAIADAGIVDYRVEATELVHLVGNASCTCDRREVPGDHPLGAGRIRESVAASYLVAAMQYDFMAVLDQQSGRHQAEAVR
jgi:hypothetical protein